MAPIRRYLRITKYSVLEVRIYLEDPTAQSWLLNSRDPVLPRIIQAVRPLVLPKLREENERAKGKGKGKKPKAVKDVVMEEDFDVSIYFTELMTRHSLLTKQKAFIEKPKMQSNSSNLTGWLSGTTENPVQLEEDEEAVHIRAESDEDEGALSLDTSDTGGQLKRPRKDSEDDLFVGDDDISEDEGFQVDGIPMSKRRRVADADDDDKKKLGVNTSYDGFSIYGRTLCLLVKRRGNKAKEKMAGASLEGWISTQAAREQPIDDD